MQNRQQAFRKISALLATGTLVMTVAANAAAEDETRAASGELLFNPLDILSGALELEGGFGLEESLSLNFSGTYAGTSSGISEVTAWGGGVGVQVFLTGQLYEGWYLYPNASIVTLDAKSFDRRASGSAYAIALLAGYQWDWRPFTLRLGLGASYYSASVTGDDIDVGFSGFIPGLDGSLGVSF